MFLQSRIACTAPLGMAAILAGTAVLGLDSAVNIDFPRITAEFRLAIAQIQWVVVSYTLTSASLILVFGRLGDMIGHRHLFRAGAAISTLAFAACAAAPDFAALLCGRILQGIGAGLLLSCCPALATHAYPERHRARAFALYTSGFAVSGAAGPIVGGLMLAHFGWACVFWVRIPIALAALVGSVALPAPPARGPEAPGGFDRRGASWLVAGTAALVLAVGTAGAQPDVAAVSALVACVAAPSFVRAERRAASPVIKLQPFRAPAFALLTVASVLINLAGFAVLLLVPFVLAAQASLTEFAGGLLLAVSPAALALSSLLIGPSVARGRTWPLVAGGACLCAGLVACSFGTRAFTLLAAGMAIAGMGQGLFQVAYLDRTAAALSPEERGVAGSLAMLTRTFGIVLGATLLMLVFRLLRAHGLGFEPAFRATFLFAAALPGLVTVAWWMVPPQVEPAR